MAKNEKFEEMMARLNAQIAKKKEEAAAKGAAAPATVAEPVKTEPIPEKKADVPALVVETPPATVASEPAKEPVVEPAKTPEPAKEPVAAEPVAEEPKRRKKAGVPIASSVIPAAVTPSTPSPIGSLDSLVKSMVSDAVRDLISSPVEMGGKPVKMRVARVFKKSGELVSASDGDVETVDTPLFVGPTATVSCGLSRTVNLGDYESAKIDVFMSVPCYLGEEQAAFEYAKKFASEKLAEEVKKVKP